MKRTIYKELLNWKNDVNHKPLIVDGARQIGKTYTVTSFGENEYESFIYINFEQNVKAKALFERTIDPKELIDDIELLFSKSIQPKRTLLFFDEIQASNRALLSLKYFYEQYSEIDIIAAGSLLGVAINRSDYSFPVGKVQTLRMMPLSFCEFLDALDESFLINEIKRCYENNNPLDENLHQMALSLLRKYLIVGGMPESVNAFIRTNKFEESTKILMQINNNYVADMIKYASLSQAVKIRAAFDSIPSQLAKDNKKFQYKVIQKGGSSSLFGESIEWLVQSGIVLKCQKVNEGKLPLNIFTDLASFKIYMSDVGLLCAKATENVIDDNIFDKLDNFFTGILCENYVCSELFNKKHNINYWASNATAEVDFVLQLEGKVIPVEVKQGLNVKSKSLSLFMTRYSSEYGLRVSTKNFGYSNRIKSIPLYAVFCI